MSRPGPAALSAVRNLKPSINLLQPSSFVQQASHYTPNAPSTSSAHKRLLGPVYQSQWESFKRGRSCATQCHLIGTRRQFSGSAKRSYKTVEEAKSRYRSGPFSWKAAALFFGTGAGLITYFRYEKARLERKRIADATKGIGKPKVGGSFDMIDHNGNKFTQDNIKGKYALVYFGFTHCPDICPDELDKMAIMIEKVKERSGNVLLPIFVSCDPARDTPAVVKAYLQDFHPDIIGLTGTWENVQAMCKAYRVYFSTPPSVKPGQDYLVDHSIYFYFMDPEGDFVEAIGRNFTADEAAKVMSDHIGDWRGRLDRTG